MKKYILIILIFVGVEVFAESKMYLEGAKVVGKVYYQSGEVASIRKHSFIYNTIQEELYFKNGNMKRLKRTYLRSKDQEIFIADLIYGENGNIKCKKENVNLDLLLSMTIKALSQGSLEKESLNIKMRLFHNLTEKDLKDTNNHKVKLVCKIKDSSFFRNDGFVFNIDYDYNIYTNSTQEIFKKGIKIYMKDKKNVIKLNEAEADNLVNKYFK